MNRKDINFFKSACKMAELSTYSRTKVGCVVVYRNKIISTGVNRDKTDPLQKRYDIYRGWDDTEGQHKVHAETDALKRLIDLDIDWRFVSIYIYRKRVDIGHGMARPCPSCMRLIKDLGIKHVYYTTDDGLVYERLN